MVTDWVPRIRQPRAAEFLEAEANENHTASLIFISLPLSQLLAIYIQCGKTNLDRGPRGFSSQPFQRRQAPPQSGHASVQFSH